MSEATNTTTERYHLEELGYGDGFGTRLGKRYGLYVAIIILATFCIKLWLVQYAPYSQGLTDDYDYLYKTLCFLEGDWKLESYRFKKTYTGPVYPMFITPWVLFDSPRARMLSIFVLQFACTSIVIWLGSCLITRFSGKRSLLAPIVLATYAPSFIYNFYTLTENLFFLQLILAMYLCVDFVKTCRSPWRFTLLVLLGISMAGTRTPGFAIVPVVWALLLINARSLGWGRTLLLGLVFAVFCVAPEQYFYRYMYEADRIASYTENLSKRFTQRGEKSIWTPISFFLMHFSTLLCYVFVTSGVWGATLLIGSFGRRWKTVDAEQRASWRNLLVYSFTMCLTLLAFAEIHLALRAQMRTSWWNFVVGRYLEPPTIVIVVSGLCALLSIRDIRRFLWLALIIVVPGLLYFALYAFNDRIYHPMHDVGLGTMALRKLRHYPQWYPWVAVGVVASIGILSRWRRVAIPVMLSMIIAFNVMTVRNSFTYMSRWSLRIAKVMEGSEWIAANLPENEKILFDNNKRLISPPPGLDGWPFRNLFSVYCGYGVMVHPRPVEWIKLPGRIDAETNLDATFGDGRYFLTYLDASPAAEMGYPIAWQNDDYVLYHLDKRQRQAIWPVAFNDFEVSHKKIKSSSRLLMAWDGCTAKQKKPLKILAGAYELHMRLNAEGCDQPPPQLHVELPGVIDQWITVTPYDKRVYTIPFELDRETDVSVNFTHKESPYCKDKSDKNNFIYSVRIIAVDTPTSKSDAIAP